HQYKQMVNNSAKKGKADYNIANSYFNLKKWNKSVKYYKQAMRQEAADIDAKYNYEMAKRKVEQQKKQDKSGQGKNDKKKKKQQKNKEKQPNKQKQQDKNNKQNKKN